MHRAVAGAGFLCRRTGASMTVAATISSVSQVDGVRDLLKLRLPLSPSPSTSLESWYDPVLLWSFTYMRPLWWSITPVYPLFGAKSKPNADARVAACGRHGPAQGVLGDW